MGVGRYISFCQLKVNKTLLNGCHGFWPSTMPSTLKALIKRVIPFRLLVFYLVQAHVLKGFAGVFCVRNYAHSAWSWISIPNPCVYPFLVLHLCCFTVQQLFGIYYQTHNATLMSHNDLIPISDQGTFLQLVKCALVSSLLSIWEGPCWWAHVWMCDAWGACWPYLRGIHYSVGAHMVGDVIR